MSPIAQRRGSEFTRIVSVGAHRPERLVPNAEIVDAIDSSDEWIQERSGIRTRRFARADETMLDLAERAGQDALDRSGLVPNSIDAVLVASVTHHMFTPAAAPMLASRLGISDAGAFDLSAACAGYCYGVGLASDMVRSGQAEHVLVVGAEKLTDVVDPTERRTAFIFGDGAGAAIIGPSDHAGIGPTVSGSDGTAWDVISPVMVDGVPGSTIRMQGPRVFSWVVESMAPVALRAVAEAGLRLDDIDVFIPHQANLRIIEALVERIGLPDRVVVAHDIVDMANTSAASVPLATERLLREGSARGGQIALQMGFGAGLAYAAQVVELPAWS